MATAEERETTVAYCEVDDTIRIFTCIRTDITAMSNKKQFTLVSEGVDDGGTKLAWFSIPRSEFDISRAAKTRRNMTEEQRAASAERLRRAREKKKETPSE